MWSTASRLNDLIAKRTSGLMQPHMKARIEKATRKQFPEGIAAFGTDALRFTFASLAGPAREINFDLGRVGGNRNFCNKLWNGARFVLMTVEGDAESGHGERRLIGDAELSIADRWIVSRFAATLAQVDGALADYRFDLAAHRAVRIHLVRVLRLVSGTHQARPARRLRDRMRRSAARAARWCTMLEALLRALHPHDAVHHRRDLATGISAGGAAARRAELARRSRSRSTA